MQGKTVPQTPPSQTKRRWPVIIGAGLILIFTVLVSVGTGKYVQDKRTQVKPTETTGSLASGADSYNFSGSLLKLDNIYSGTVIVQPGPKGKIGVQRGGVGSTGFKLTAKHSGETFTIGQTGECATKRQPCTAQFTINIPPNVKVSVRGSGAALELDRLTTDLDVSNSGNITVRGLSGANVMLKASKGDIIATELSVKQMEAHASNGSLSLQFAGQPQKLTARTDNGPLTLRLPQPGTYNVSAVAKPAKPTISVKQDKAARSIINAATSNGPLEISY